jgi:hypothetical protein
MWHRELGHLVCSAVCLFDLFSITMSFALALTYQVKTYEDKQEGLVDMCWHPHRPLFVSVLRASGRLRICSTVFRCDSIHVCKIDFVFQLLCM